MSILSPTEFADLLGLSSGEVSFSGEEPAGEQIERAVKSLLSLDELDESARLSFWAHFNAQYLPSLVSALLLSSGVPRFDSRSWSFLLIHSMQDAMIGEQPQASRFVRLHQAESVELYTFCLRKISRYSFTGERFTEDATTAYMRAWINILELMRHQMHPSQELPELDETILSALIKLYPRFEERASLSATFSPTYKATSMMLEMVTGSGLKLCSSIPSTSEQARTRCWWKCEAMESQPSSPCVQPRSEEGEEMMQCSRCLAVRYCSNEHQKLDWKRHKQVCFAPSW